MTTTYLPDVPVETIRPHGATPRRAVGNVDDLAASIKAHGLLEPLVVAPINGSEYRLIAGHRRLAAAKQAGIRAVPALLREDLDTPPAQLEAMLVDFGGSVLVVSHDRWLLDRVATAILAFEGDGRVEYHVGNYSDYADVRVRPARGRGAPASEAAMSVRRSSDDSRATVAAESVTDPAICSAAPSRPTDAPAM